jgi:hypothetical protein
METVGGSALPCHTKRKITPPTQSNNKIATGKRTPLFLSPEPEDDFIEFTSLIEMDQFIFLDQGSLLNDRNNNEGIAI